MWTFQTVAITIVAIIIYAIYAHFSYDPSSPKTSGGKSLKKATSMALNADLIKGVYKKIKGNH